MRITTIVALKNQGKPCDFHTKPCDTPITESHSYINTLFEYNPDDHIPLEVVRGDETTQVEIILGEAQQT